MKCFFCESPQIVIVGGAMLESSALFHDVVECLECGGVQLVAPRQVVIGNLVVMSADSLIKLASEKEPVSTTIETIGDMT